ncbi:hypothetical protein SDC9_157885 [bioreactor metagenome]|uniref:Uncharacterized protein n=1 Tax=bioreactor metagenome TaxID=1076179 RepID=A0A645F9L1_9ZZZZ
MEGCDAILQANRQFADDVVDDDDRPCSDQQQRLLVESEDIADTDQGAWYCVRGHDQHLQQALAWELLAHNQHCTEHGKQAGNRGCNGSKGHCVTDRCPASGECLTPVCKGEGVVDAPVHHKATSYDGKVEGCDEADEDPGSHFQHRANRFVCQFSKVGGGFACHRHEALLGDPVTLDQEGGEGGHQQDEGESRSCSQVASSGNQHVCLGGEYTIVATEKQRVCKVSKGVCENQEPC